MGWSQSQWPERGMEQGAGCPAPFRDQEGQWGDQTPPGTVPKGSQLQPLSLGQGRAQGTEVTPMFLRNFCAPRSRSSSRHPSIPLAGSAPTSSLPCPGAALWEALQPPPSPTNLRAESKPTNTPEEFQCLGPQPMAPSWIKSLGSCTPAWPANVLKGSHAGRELCPSCQAAAADPWLLQLPLQPVAPTRAGPPPTAAVGELEGTPVPSTSWCQPGVCTPHPTASPGIHP